MADAAADRRGGRPEQGGSPRSGPGQSCSPLSVAASLDFPRIKEVGGQTPSSLTFSGVARPQQGLEWGPCSTLSRWRCQGVWGSQPLVCSVSGNGVPARGPGEAALRAAVSEGLVPSSQGSKGSIFSLFWGPLPVWERKQKDPWQEMVFLLQPLFQWPWLMGERPAGGSPWLGVPNTVLSPWSPGGGRGLPVMTANPTSQAGQFRPGDRHIVNARIYHPSWAPGPASPLRSGSASPGGGLKKEVLECCSPPQQGAQLSLHSRHRQLTTFPCRHNPARLLSQKPGPGASLKGLITGRCLECYLDLRRFRNVCCCVNNSSHQV